MSAAAIPATKGADAAVISAGYAAYGIAAALGAIVAAPAVAVGLAFDKRWRYGITERLGALPDLAALLAKSPRVWVHAASIGEVRAAHPLLEALRRQRPDAGIFVTTTTPEGNRTARLLRVADAVSMLPADLPGLPGHVLDAVQPDALVLLETELWPALLRAARKRLVPSLIVNGRISERSFRRYSRVRSLLGPMLDDIASFAMQSAGDRDRILALGADPRRVEVHGNLKFDALALPLAAPPAPLESLAKETTWVAGSTHEGEEAAVAEAYLRLKREIPSLRLVVAPRHLKRTEDARRALESRGIPVVKRSLLTSDPPPDAAVLLDTAGELAATYGVATAVFVGGSLVPKGGHNPLEPLAHGKPVAFGPFTMNFRDVTDAVLASGGGRRVADAAALADAMRGWLADPGFARDTGAKARAAILATHGAVARNVALLERWIGKHSAVAHAKGVDDPWLGADPHAGIRAAARIAALGYRGVVSARRALYDARVMPVQSTQAPVIAVGGVSVGGSGKTPAAIDLARRLLAMGRRPAVVSRGYGAKPGPTPAVISAGSWNDGRAHVETRVERAGDEPLVIASRAGGAAVVVHPDRVAAARVAEDLGADVIVLDDGLQHRRLGRRLEVACLDARRPLGNGLFLPAGPLRDLPARLADAGLVLLTRCDAAGAAAVDRAIARLSLVSDAPIARFAHRITSFRPGIPIDELSALRPYAFCGIASPQAFFDSLAAAGVTVSGTEGFPDHAAFDDHDVRLLVEQAAAAGARALVTTEKDAVRFPSCPLPVYVAVLDLAPMSERDSAVVEVALRKSLES